MSASDIRAALYEHFPAQEYAVLFEVGKSTGAGTSGWADAMAMSLWPSRGLTLQGFEIKAYRGDWLRELKNPAKAEDFVSLCDHWSIAAPEGLVRPDELPPTWGLLELLKGGKMKQRVAAPRLPGAGADFKRSFVAALLRRAAEVDRGQVQAMVEKEVERRMEGREQRIQAEIENRTRKASELLAKVEEIKNLTGVDLKDWTPAEDVAAAMRFAMSANLAGKYSGLGVLAKSMSHHASTIEKLLSELGVKAEA